MNTKLKTMISTICFVAFIAVILISAGQTVQAAPAPYLPESVTLDKAKKMIEAAEKKADEIGVPMVIAVVDGGGNLVVQERMDN
ncbi:MAG: GlcG/HbpS family heme-binding protein, partial [Sporomusa sp.]